jgi:TolB-like protein/DNA-binding winged helix-turn-helix (wHTH) protein
MGGTGAPDATIATPATPEESLRSVLVLSKDSTLDPMTATKTRIGAWIADPSSNLLLRDERSVRLEPRAMDVLMHLAARTGAATSVNDLMTAVWKNLVVTDGSVYLAISQLREALGNTDGGKSYIETVPKRGYRLIVPVEPVAERVAVVPTVGALKRSWKIPAIAVALLAAVLATVWVLRPTEPAIDRSLAVLPFADLSPEGDQAYLADGFTEEVLNRLAGLRDLRVIARTSSFRLRGRGADARAVGEKLGVEHLLLGSVRKAGDRLRITAQLIEARTGQQLWAQTYERQLVDIFSVQDEIAKAVSAAMQVKLRVGELARMPGMTNDVEAYDEYLRGMALNIIARRESYPLAIAHLQRAISIDPKFSMAWSGLSGTYDNAAFAIPERAAEWHQAAADSLERARQLTPEAPHVVLGLGIVATRRGDWLGGARFFQRLEEIHAERGMSAESAGPRGVFLLCVGRVREAIPALESARAHDPLAPGFAGFLSLAYTANGDYPAALGEVDRGLTLDGFREGLLGLGLSIALASGDRPEIDRRLAAITDNVPAAAIHRRMAEFLDQPGGAAAEIRAIAATAADTEKVVLATWAGYFAEPHSALEILADVIGRRAQPSAIWHPLFADARRLTGFATLVGELGMPDYWRVHGFGDFCGPVAQRLECH